MIPRESYLDPTIAYPDVNPASLLADSTMHAEWNEGVSYDQFMEKLREIQQACTALNDDHDKESVVLVLDQHFWDEYQALSSARRTALSTVIQSIPFTDVQFPDSLPTRPGWLTRWWWWTSSAVVWQFVQVLQALPTITVLTMDMTRIENVSRIQSNLIRAFDRITRFELYCYDNDSEADRDTDIRELVAGLQGHPSIQCINLFISRTWYPFVMPVLRTIPLLNQIELWGGTLSDEDWNADPGPNVMACISDAYPTTGLAAEDISRELKLVYFDLSSESTQQGLANILTSGCIESFAIYHGQFDEHDTILPDALAMSSLRRLWLDSGAIPPVFVEGIGSMCELVNLTFNEVTSNGTVLRVVEMAAFMPSLTNLSIRTDYSFELMDLALAKCVRQNKSLRMMSLSAYGRESIPKAKVLLPAFEDAMKDNYQVREVLIFSWERDNPFDLAMVQNVKMFVRLNCAGRDYFVRDARDRHKGIEVLECVNDDLNCLLVHLRENSLLCQPEEAEGSHCKSEP